MGLLVLLALALLAAAVPDAAPHVLAIDRHPPDLFLALAAYLALRGRGYEAVPWAMALGALKDCASLDPLGTHAFVLGTVALLLSSGRERAGSVRGVTRAFAVGAAGVLAHAISLVRSIPVTGEVPGGGGLPRRAAHRSLDGGLRRAPAGPARPDRRARRPGGEASWGSIVG